MASQYLESTDPGKSWSYYVHKPQGRPAYATATEGELSEGGRVFSYILHSARRHTVMLNGTNTAKNRANAMRTLVAEMEANDLIVKGQSFNLDG